MARAPYNNTAQAYTVDVTGAIGAAVGDPFPCRLVESRSIVTVAFPFDQRWTYLTADIPCPSPGWGWTSIAAHLNAFYIGCYAVAAPAGSDPVWLAWQLQYVTEPGETPYYRWILIPFPF